LVRRHLFRKRGRWSFRHTHRGAAASCLRTWPAMSAS